MKDVLSHIRSRRTYFDGGFGTLLQAAGLPAGTPPELWNLTKREEVTAIHRAYLEAGSHIITTNTFGVNRDKYENYEDIIEAAVLAAKEAVGEREDAFIAFDMGPTGRMTEPLGDLSFEEAVSIYADSVRVASRLGVDLILIETMNDAYETKAAVIAAKENSSLPVFVTNAYDEGGKLMTGADIPAMVAMLEGLGVDAIGMNCSFGPDVMCAHMDAFARYASLPIIANPNAGLPRVKNGKTVYDISPDAFADYMRALAEKGATVLGGCCGTTPLYIEKTVAATKALPYALPTYKEDTLVSSYTHAVVADGRPLLIGERINPTGKPRLKEALRSKDVDYVLGEAIRQVELGAHILDVNVGLPDIDEAELMLALVKAIQTVVDTPLQLDSSSPAVLEGAMRAYNGKPLINSVNGEEAHMHALFPLVKKYGGTVIALTMDEGGIPQTAEERVAIAEKIAAVAAEYGIGKKDLVVDPLCMTVSSDSQSAMTTLKAVELLKAKGFCVSLGVSNVSFGLPAREKINACFFTSALEKGLDFAIMNPASSGMMDVYHAFMALHGLDPACLSYIAYASATAEEKKAERELPLSCREAVIKGLKDKAEALALSLLKEKEPLAVIDGEIIPALNEVGRRFEEKTLYLPQLLMSAEAASAVFEVLKPYMAKKTEETGRGVILATVKGDMHDIGKNIVKVLLESYGFTVYDLGKDVSPEAVLSAVLETGCRLVGLSALMTTTVPEMEKTVALLKAEKTGATVMVGGAVMNEEYARLIGADGYAPDAMGAVRFAREYYEGKR